MYELVTFCVTVSVIIGATTIGAVAGVLVYVSLNRLEHQKTQKKTLKLHTKGS